MKESARRRQAARWFSVALLLGALASPGPPVAGVMLTLWLVVISHERIARAWSVRQRARQARVATPLGAAALGTDQRGQPVLVSDRQLAAHALIVGASGAGKSTTLLALLEDRIRRGHPVVVVDMKGSPAFAAALRDGARRAGRELAVWTPDGPTRWNPLAYGNPTALKDKLISTERFTEPHYQRAAERYLQTALQVLEAVHPERAPTLAEVVRVMEPRRLGALLGGVPSPLRERGQDYLESLTRDGLSAVRGLGTRLALLSESSAGQWLDPTGGRPAVDLRAALGGGSVVLFSLNSSVYGKLASQVGALAIQDLVSASGYRLQEGRAVPPAIIAVDEFSALGADNVLALLARGRESGMSVLLATQELADLERAGGGFRDQVLGITGIKIAHRQDVPASASTFAQMVGTRQVWEHTEQVRGPLATPAGSRGTRRRVERFIVHPNEIKTLPTGHAVLLAKLPVTEVARVQVRAPAAPAPAAPTTAAPPPTATTPATAATPATPASAATPAAGPSPSPTPAGLPPPIVLGREGTPPQRRSPRRDARRSDTPDRERGGR